MSPLVGTGAVQSRAAGRALLQVLPGLSCATGRVQLCLLCLPGAEGLTDHQKVRKTLEQTLVCNMDTH